jgi:hypothetical protein
MELIDRIVSVIYNDLEPLRFTHIVLNKKDLKNIVKKHYPLYDKKKKKYKNFHLLTLKAIRSKDVKVGSFLLIEDFKQNENRVENLMRCPTTGEITYKK